MSDLAFLVRHPRFRRLSSDGTTTTVAWQTRTVGEASLRGPLDEVVRMVVAELRRYDAIIAAPLTVTGAV